MAKLAIYMNETGDSVVHHAGFSWLAALALPVWALRRRLYKSAAVTFVINLFAGEAATRWVALIPDETLRTGIQLGYYPLLWLVFGFSANIFHRIVLERAGYFMTSADPSRL